MSHSTDPYRWEGSRRSYVPVHPVAGIFLLGRTFHRQDLGNVRPLQGGDPRRGQVLKALPWAIPFRRVAAGAAPAPKGPMRPQGRRPGVDRHAGGGGADGDTLRVARAGLPGRLFIKSSGCPRHGWREGKRGGDQGLREGPAALRRNRPGKSIRGNRAWSGPGRSGRLGERRSRWIPWE
jgi:hypothetical protein